MNDYSRFARFYDDFIDEQFQARLLEVLEHYCRRFPPPGRRMLDLACGTGTVAMHFARQGWQVTGIDASEAMLEKAREKLGDGPGDTTDGEARETASETSGDRSVELLCGDMRSFALAEPVDLVTCNSDSINHLAGEEDLAATFNSVAAALVPSGVFIFDINTPYTLRTKWSDNTITGRRGLISYRWYHTYEPDDSMGVLEATFKVGGNGHSLTFTERFCERAFEVDRVEALLRDAGLDLMEAVDFFKLMPLDEKSVRATFIAGKLK